MLKKDLDKLLHTEDAHLKKLHSIVLEAIEEENLMTQKLAEFEDKDPSFSNKLADRLATFGGSWRFILSFGFIICLWAIANVYMLSRPFDPFPFIFLNLLLSCLAALQAPVIMMSQNRKESRDRQRAVNDYMVNLKAEIEIRHIHQKLDLLMEEQMRTLFEIQKVQVEMISEVRELLREKAIGR